MTKLKLKSIFMVLILLASIGVASASPFDDVVNWIKENANPLSWYLKSPSYSNGFVTFYVTYTGGWSAVIKDPSYNIVASTSGSGYGSKTMELKPTVTGTYLFILNCPSADCGKEDPFTVSQVYATPVIVMPTPVITVVPTPTPVVTQTPRYVCADGSVVIDLSLCPTQPKVKIIPDFIMGFVNWFLGIFNIQPLSLVESSGININPNTIEGGKVRVEVNGIFRSFSGNSIGVGTSPGASFKLEAVANSGYVFTHWENNGVKITTNPLYGTTTTGYLTYKVYYITSGSKPVCDKIGGCDTQTATMGVIDSIIAWIKNLLSAVWR